MLDISHNLQWDGRCPRNCPSPRGSGPHLIHGSSGQPESIPQTASQSVQPFWHSSQPGPTGRHTDHRTFVTIGHILCSRYTGSPTLVFLVNYTTSILTQKRASSKFNLYGQRTVVSHEKFPDKINSVFTPTTFVNLHQQNYNHHRSCSVENR